MAELTGKTISHYKILERIGAGGTGVVYKAEDTKLGRLAALKFLPQALGEDDAKKRRFIQEAKAASALDHPNICTIFEIDETDARQMFIAMAYYEGQTLKSIIDEQKFTTEGVISIAIQVTEGLDRAHQKGIVHRDIKPANIIVTKDGVVKILDFGVAKMANIKLTNTDATLGTIAYMCPEQIRSEAVDQRADIWSLGVICYEMLSGSLPFSGAQEHAVMYSILNREPAPLTILQAGVSPELERIITKMMAKDPAERYHNVDEIRIDLKSLSGELTFDVSQQLLYKIMHPGRKRNILYGAIMFIVLLAIIAGLSFPEVGEKKRLGITPVAQTAETNSGSQWQNSIAVLPFENVSPDPEQEYFCDGMTEQIITNLSQLQGLKVIARTSVMRLKETQMTIPEIAKELHVEHILTGSVRKSGKEIRVTAKLIRAVDRSHLWAEDYDRELMNVFAVQDDISEAIARALLQELTPKEAANLKTRQTENLDAYEYALKGRFFHRKIDWELDNYEENFKKSENMLKKAIEHDPGYADAFAELADLYNSRLLLPYSASVASISEEDQKKYLQLSRHYVEIALQLNPNSAVVMTARGWMYRAKGDIDKQYHSFKKALEIDPNHPRGANEAMGTFLVNRGLHHLAISFYTKAIELDPLVHMSYHGRGNAYFFLGELEKAAIEYQKALEIESNFTVSLKRLAEIYIYLKDFRRAKAFLTKIEELNPGHTGVKYRWALYYAAQGEKEKALARDQWHTVYLLLGMKDEAIQRLIREDLDQFPLWGGWYLWFRNQRLKDQRLYDSIRDEPRFIEIVKQKKKVYEENLRKYGDVALN